MSRCRRTLAAVALLATLLTGLLAAPGGLAQEATPEASPAATPMAAPPAPCGPEIDPDPDNPLPAGLVREVRIAAPITVAGSAEQVEAVATLVCLAPGTTIAQDVPGFPEPTADIGQDFTTQLVMVEGTLQIKVVKRCAFDPTSGACEVTNGVANYRAVDDYTTPVELTAGWSTIPVGAIVTLSDVTVSIRSTDTTARFVASGITVSAGGGGCSGSCFRSPP